MTLRPHVYHTASPFQTNLWLLLQFFAGSGTASWHLTQERIHSTMQQRKVCVSGINFLLCLPTAPQAYASRCFVPHAAFTAKDLRPAHTPASAMSGMADGVVSGGTHEPGRRQCSITAMPANRLICSKHTTYLIQSFLLQCGQFGTEQQLTKGRTAYR